MSYPTQEQINNNARTARLKELSAIADSMVMPDPPDEPKTKKKRSSLTSLLAAFDRAEKLREETEVLKPRLDKEIAEYLASGEALDEKIAQGLQTKRCQLEMIPAKLDQIDERLKSLKDEINTELGLRFVEFEHQFSHMNKLVCDRLSELLRPIMADDFTLDRHISMWLVGNTKLNRKVVGLLSYIRHPMMLGNAVAGARALIAREGEAAKILAIANQLTEVLVKE
jgi:hypothetical protein